jgi:hypothetical protein
MPSQHATSLISWRSKDPTLRQWIRDEADRRGVDQKEVLDEMAAEYREKHEGPQPYPEIMTGALERHREKHDPDPKENGR